MSVAAGKHLLTDISIRKKIEGERINDLIEDCIGQGSCQQALQGADWMGRDLLQEIHSSEQGSFLTVETTL